MGGGRPDADPNHSVGAKNWAKTFFRGPEFPSWSEGRPAGGGRFCSICRWHSTVEPTIREPKTLRRRGRGKLGGGTILGSNLKNGVAAPPAAHGIVRRFKIQFREGQIFAVQKKLISGTSSFQFWVPIFSAAFFHARDPCPLFFLSCIF